MSVRRILIVDDDDSIRALLRMTVPPEEELEILDARDGTEALALLERESPHLVILDWRMPGASGEEVLAQVKTRSPQLPVIVLTAEAGAPQRRVAESLGADVFLTKPFSPLELLREIERLLPGPDAPGA